MEIKRLNLGILLRETSPYIILSLQGHFIIDNHDFCKGSQLYDIILFESFDNELVFAIGLSNLRYFKLQQKLKPNVYYNDSMSAHNIYVPEICAKTSDSFIVDYGRFNIVVRHNDCLYINSNYTESEFITIKSSIYKKKKERQSIRIEQIDPNKHPFPSVEFARKLKNEIEPLYINPSEDIIFHRIDDINNFYKKKSYKKECVKKTRNQNSSIDLLLNENTIQEFQRYQEEEAEKLKYIGRGHGWKINFFCGFENSREEINAIIQKINEYISTLNVNELLESFTITNEEFFYHRAGKDDYYYVEKCSKEFDDKYINSLFPKIGETVYEDSGYSSAENMRIDIEKRPYINEEKDLINKAKDKYSDHDHRTFLLNRYISEYFNEQIRIVRAAFREQEEYYKNTIKSRSAFLTKVFTLIQSSACTDFIEKLEKEIDNYYRKGELTLPYNFNNQLF